MGSHDAFPFNASHSRGDGNSTNAAGTAKNPPQAPVETPVRALSLLSLGLGQSCPLPVVPEA